VKTSRLVNGRPSRVIRQFPAVRPNYSRPLKCVDSAQPLAIGGGIHNTAENKARPASKQGAKAFSSELDTGSHRN
jgi:hypothetical protein